MNMIRTDRRLQYTCLIDLQLYPEFPWPYSDAVFRAMRNMTEIIQRGCDSALTLFAYRHTQRTDQ